MTKVVQVAGTTEREEVAEALKELSGYHDLKVRQYEETVAVAQEHLDRHRAEKISVDGLLERFTRLEAEKLQAQGQAQTLQVANKQLVTEKKALDGTVASLRQEVTRQNAVTAALEGRVGQLLAKVEAQGVFFFMDGADKNRALVPLVSGSRISLSKLPQGYQIFVFKAPLPKGESVDFYVEDDAGNLKTFNIGEGNFPYGLALGDYSGRVKLGQGMQNIVAVHRRGSAEVARHNVVVGIVP